MKTKEKLNLHVLTFIAIALMLSTIGHTSTDIYIPALPLISDYFQVENQWVQLSLVCFTIGLGCSQIFYGAYSDKHGRNKAMILGLSVSIIGTMACILATDIYWLNIGRFVQGLGFGVASSVPRAMVTDVFTSPRERAKFGSYIGMFVPLTLSLAPILGGYIQRIFFWQAIFIFILVYTLLAIMVIIFKLPESNENLDHTSLEVKNISSNIKSVIKNRTFIGCTICSSLAFGGILSYLTASPFLLQDIVGMSPIEYSYLALIIGVTLTCTGIVNSKLVVKQGIKKMLMSGAIFMALGGLGLISFHIAEKISVYSVMIPTILYAIGISFTFPNSIAGSVLLIPRNIMGLACALFGTIQILIGSSLSLVIAILPENSQLPLAMIYFFCGFVSLLSIVFIAKLDE